jgi:hypothetical protein
MRWQLARTCRTDLCWQQKVTEVIQTDATLPVFYEQSVASPDHNCGSSLGAAVFFPDRSLEMQRV